MTNKVLFVDDDMNILASFRRRLGRRFDITTVPGGEQGLEVIDIIKATFDERDRLDGLVVGTRFQAYCEGNEIKYRLRSGFKLDKDEDIDKAMWYYDKRQEG